MFGLRIDIETIKTSNLARFDLPERRKNVRLRKQLVQLGVVALLVEVGQCCGVDVQFVQRKWHLVVVLQGAPCIVLKISDHLMGGACPARAGHTSCGCLSCKLVGGIVYLVSPILQQVR